MLDMGQMTFGEFLKRQRMAIPLTQEELGRAVGVSRTYIINIEKGRVALPNLELRQKLGDAIGFDENELRALGVVKDRPQVQPVTPPGNWEMSRLELIRKLKRVWLNAERVESLNEILDEYLGLRGVDSEHAVDEVVRSRDRREINRVE